MTLPTEHKGLFERLRDIHDDRKHLQEAAQLALQVEFTTIPAYLQAMYSISDVESSAYQTLRSVVMEEMFHLNQAANTVVALGALPCFTGAAVPTYPCYLPHANQKTTPFVGLYRASTDVFENVFVAIEEPAPPHVPPRGDNYSTIAQLYESLLAGMESYSGSTPLFQEDPNGRQRTDIYLGKFGGKPVHVTCMRSAKLGITEIMQQGEGTVPEGQEMRASQPFATYNNYATRSDGTYGPIVGLPHELSHFVKFRQVALDTANFPPTYPIVSNPRREEFSERALALATAFDYCYSLMLDALEHSFHKHGRTQADPFFAVVLPLMHQYLPSLARMLMTTPLREQGDPAVGPNAAPTWLYSPHITLADVARVLQPLLGSNEFSNGELDVIKSIIANVHHLSS